MWGAMARTDAETRVAGRAARASTGALMAALALYRALRGRTGEHRAACLASPRGSYVSTPVRLQVLEAIEGELDVAVDRLVGIHGEGPLARRTVAVAEVAPR